MNEAVFILPKAPCEMALFQNDGVKFRQDGLQVHLLPRIDRPKGKHGSSLVPKCGQVSNHMTDIRDALCCEKARAPVDRGRTRMLQEKIDPRLPAIDDLCWGN